MKTFTYAAAIALLTASTAFAQSSGTGSSSSMQNMPAQNQSMSNQDMSGQNSAGQNSAGQATGQPSDIKGNMNQSANPSAGDMSNSGDNTQASRDMSNAPKHRKLASARSDRGQNARENETTMELNRQQLAANGNMSAAGAGMSGNGGSSFNNGAPQQAQAGGANCTPDNPSCGTARENPGINSSPQHRTYDAGTGVGQ